MTYSNANFTPELKGYSNVKPFRFWCQKVLPLVYDDSLSYYELLCKVVDYLNNVISDLSATEDNVGDLLTAYNQLQDYVNNYFTNLDVQEEINNKLDAMFADGTIPTMIEEYVYPYIQTLNQNYAELDNQINETMATQNENIATLTTRVNNLVINNTTNLTGYNVVTVESTTAQGGNTVTENIPKNAEILQVCYSGYNDTNDTIKSDNISYVSTPNVPSSTQQQVVVTITDSTDTRFNVFITYAISEDIEIAELTDIRVGYDDTVYSSAGDAVRGQVEDLHTVTNNIIANTEFTISGVKAITPAIQNMFEKTIFNDDVGYAPQGLAVYGNVAYISNAVTSPVNVITEINLLTGDFITHTISGLTYGANSLAIDPVKGLLYAAEHRDGGRVFVIDITAWQIVETKTLPSQITSISNNGWNIVYDPIDQCFYNYSNKEYKIYKLNSSFEIIETINIIADDRFPTVKPGVTQGFGYDGTYFYIPRSEVYDVYGNSFTFVVDKSGKIIKYIRGCHDEIEEYAYDFSTGKSYTCYAVSATGYITEFVTDSGWIAINDYLSDNYQSKTTPARIDFENTDAKFRIRDGIIYFNGKIKVINNNGTLCYIDGRIAPMNDVYSVVSVTETTTYASQHDTSKLNLSATTYWSPDFTYKYVPILNRPVINGYFWLDGVSAPLERY